MRILSTLGAALLLVACNTEAPTTPTNVEPSLAKAAKAGGGASMEFGEVTHNVGSPFPPPDGHDGSFHAYDKVRPHNVVIPAGGTVTFNIGAFHQVSIYEAGIKFEDVVPQGAESLTAPFPIPDFLVVAPAGLIASDNLSTALSFGTSQWVSPPGTFDTPGKYLVLCRVAPHFFEAHMHGYVTVK
jgi:plastocyanin